MAFTIHAFKDGHIVQTLRLGARVAAEKARALFKQGWKVHVTDQACCCRQQKELSDQLGRAGTRGPVDRRSAVIKLAEQIQLEREGRAHQRH
jgi:hypothetical protein